MAKPSKKSSLIEPSIRFPDEKHVLEALFEGDPEELPEIKSIGYMRFGDKPNSWISYVITTKGKEVIKIEVEEPNLRGIAEETAKITFVNEFVDQELV